MFEQPTVFILGAGASASYDYPTGTELIKFVRSACKNLETEFLKRNQYIPLQHLPAYCREKYKNGPNKQDGRLICYEEARSFKEFLKVIEKTKPLVIDHFLSDNPSLSETGRFLISWVINECAEKKFDAAAEKDWIRYIQAKLLDGCESTEDLCNPEKNHVHFITFNYDTSLEEILFSRLCSIEKLSQGHAEIQKFI